MKLSNSISAGIAKMESKLMGLSSTTTIGNEMETGSMSGTELIGQSSSSVCVYHIFDWNFKLFFSCKKIATI